MLLHNAIIVSPVGVKHLNEAFERGPGFAGRRPSVESCGSELYRQLVCYGLQSQGPFVEGFFVRGSWMAAACDMARSLVVMQDSVGSLERLDGFAVHNNNAMSTTIFVCRSSTYETWRQRSIGEIPVGLVTQWMQLQENPSKRCSQHSRSKQCPASSVEHAAAWKDPVRRSSATHKCPPVRIDVQQTGTLGPGSWLLGPGPSTSPDGRSGHLCAATGGR